MLQTPDSKMAPYDRQATPLYFDLNDYIQIMQGRHLRGLGAVPQGKRKKKKGRKKDKREKKEKKERKKEGNYMK